MSTVDEEPCTCPNGHPVLRETNFCAACGAPVPTTEASPPRATTTPLHAARLRLIAAGIVAALLVVGAISGAVVVLVGNDDDGPDTTTIAARSEPADQTTSITGADASSATPDWSAHGWWDLGCIAPAVPEPGDPPAGHVTINASSHFPSSNPDYVIWVVAASCFVGGNSQVIVFDVSASTGQVESKQTLMHPSNDGSTVNVTKVRRLRDEDPLVIDGETYPSDRVRVSGTVKQSEEAAPSQRFVDEYSQGAKAWGRSSHRVTPSTSPSSPAQTAPGFGGVTLGMSLDDLLASGEVTRMDPSPGCADRGDCEAPCETYGLAAGGEADMAYSGGIVGQIVFEGEMTTPEGIRIGSTVSDLRAAYPSAKGSPLPYYPDTTEYRIPLAGGAAYYAYVTTGTVGKLLLSQGGPICYD